MGKTIRRKLPYLDDDSEFNLELQRGLHSEKLTHRDPDIMYEEVWGVRGKRKAKNRMAKKHRRDNKKVLEENINLYKDES